MATEVLIRLSGFVMVLGLMASWEVLAPRRPLTTSKVRRWVANLSVVVFGSAARDLSGTSATDAPYGSEKLYNALRLAMKLQQEHAEAAIRIFLMADAVTAALPNQTTPQGYYNIERMLKAVISKQGQVKACGTCVEARGVEKLSLVEGVEISTMSQFGAVGGGIRQSAHVLTTHTVNTHRSGL